MVQESTLANQVAETDLRDIAAACREFEHVINAMGYGYSLLNVAPARYRRRCPDCIHWAGGSCAIFRRFVLEHNVL